MRIVLEMHGVGVQQWPPIEASVEGSILNVLASLGLEDEVLLVNAQTSCYAVAQEIPHKFLRIVGKRSPDVKRLWDALKASQRIVEGEVQFVETQEI